MKKVRLKCPECETILQIPVEPGDAGKRVVVTCTCGQKLRTQLPVADPPAQKLEEIFGDILRNSRIV